MNQMLDRAKKIGWDISEDPLKSGDKKLIKISDKFLDDLALTAAEVKRIKNIESRTWQLMGEAANQSYKVVTAPKNIQTMQRGRMTAQATLGVIGQIAYSSVLAAQGDPGAVSGNIYKVSKE